jgi:hypothetical protein
MYSLQATSYMCTARIIEIVFSEDEDWNVNDEDEPGVSKKELSAILDAVSTGNGVSMGM